MTSSLSLSISFNAPSNPTTEGRVSATRNAQNYGPYRTFHTRTRGKQRRKSERELCVSKYRILDPGDGWKSFIFMLIVTDFLYYWLHRWAHEINLLWAAHTIHHSGEDYNLALSCLICFFCPERREYCRTFLFSFLTGPWSTSLLWFFSFVWLK